MANSENGSGAAGEWKLGKLRGGFCAFRYNNGKRERHSLRTSDANEARRALIDLKRVQQLRQIDAGFLVADLIERYISDKGSKPALEYRLKAVKGFFGGYSPNQIDQALCLAFTAFRSAQTRSTIITDLSGLATVLSWARKSKLIKDRPHIWKPVAPPPKDIRLTVGEIARLEEAAEYPHLKLFVRLAFSTAARSGALLALTWSRVDFEKRQIVLRDPQTDLTRKGRATIPISAGLYQALIKAKTEAVTPFVIEYGGQPIKRIVKGFRTLAKLAGLPQASPHILRHSAACCMAEAGVPMAKIAQYLGHTDSRVTERIYARYSPDFLRDAAQAVDF